MLTIDGSVLEGGGQILRIALGLSCLCKINVKIIKIRAGRKKPGLAAQHLQGIRLIQQICGAKVKGDAIGSEEVEFSPNQITGGKYFVDTGTAGSVALLLQIALPVAYFANGPVTLTLKGGTNAEMAPQIDFATEIFRPNLERFGASFDFDLLKRGYFPKGGGHVEISLNPVKYFECINLVEAGQITKFFGWSFVANNVPIRVAHEMVDGAKSVFKGIANRPIDLEAYKETAQIATENCSGIIVGCETSTGCILGGGALGNRNEKPFDSGRNAANQIEAATKLEACVDEHTQDQLILFMALAKGNSRIKTGPLTLHTQTAILITETLLNIKFKIEECNNGSVIIECNGIGLENKNL